MFGAWLNTLTETVTATVAPATHIAKVTPLTQLPLWEKGLLTTLLGLAGVFLVLLLFFAAIKLMQNFKDAKATEND